MLFSALVFSGEIRFLWPHPIGLWLCLGMLLLQWNYQNTVTLIILGKARSEHSWLDKITHRLEKMLSGQSWSLRSLTWCCQTTTLNRVRTTTYFGMERNLGFPSETTSNYSGNCWAVIDLSLNDPFSFLWWRLSKSHISFGTESSPCFPDHLLYTQHVAPSLSRQAAEHSSRWNPYLGKLPCSWRIQISCTQRFIWNTFLRFCVCNRQKHFVVPLTWDKPVFMGVLVRSL